jgi:AcrR family transcriptional regulator
VAAATDTARDRLLAAAAELVEAAGGGDVSTRAITERAGVQAPTLYHHFGNKQALLDAVVTHDFTEFLVGCLADGAPGGGAADPIDDIRAGWDLHVRYGIEHPGFYALIHGRAVPGEPGGVLAEVEAMILRALHPAALQGRLRVPPARAARQILAASTGVVLTLIAQPPGERDLALSDQLRDAVLEGLTVPAPGTRRGTTDGRAGGRAGNGRIHAGAEAGAQADGAEADADGRTAADARAGVDALASTAIALDAALAQQRNPALSAGETALLREWLNRLSGGPA